MTNPTRPLIIFNDDSDTLRRVDEPLTEDAISKPLRHLAGTQVGALCWGMDGGDIGYSWPSKVLENYYDRMTADEPRNLMAALHRKGIDYLPLLIDRAHAQGLTFYGSFRMNDCHHRSDPRGTLSSQFWQEHQHYRLWDITDGKTYYNASLDYTHEEVCGRKRAAIRETLSWYAFDGIELDFCRNPYLFPADQAWNRRHLMTEWIKQIRRDLQETQQRTGRAMDLIIRVPFEARICRNGGMDVEAWIDMRLMDILVMSDFLNDNNRSIEPWHSACHARGIAFYPSIENGPSHSAAHNHVCRLGIDEILRQDRAAAQNYLSQGAQGVYFFNYPCHLFEVSRSPEEIDRLASILNEAGSLVTLRGKPQQFTYWKQSPLQLESHRPAEFHQTVHIWIMRDDLADRSSTLSFLQEVVPNPHAEMELPEEPTLPMNWVTYWLNGKLVLAEWICRMPQEPGRILSGHQVGRHEKITIAIPPGALHEGENRLGFFIPSFPQPHDPYLHIYQVTIDFT